MRVAIPGSGLSRSKRERLARGAGGEATRPSLVYRGDHGNANRIAAGFDSGCWF